MNEINYRVLLYLLYSSSYHTIPGFILLPSITGIYQVKNIREYLIIYN